MRVRAVIGRRPVAMLTLVRLSMFCGVGIRVALPNDRTRVAVCHGDASERAMKSRIRLQGKRRLGRREDRRAKNNQGKEAAEHVKSKVRVVKLTKNERGTAALVVLFQPPVERPDSGGLERSNRDARAPLALAIPRHEVPDPLPYQGRDVHVVHGVVRDLASLAIAHHAELAQRAQRVRDRGVGHPDQRR